MVFDLDGTLADTVQDLWLGLLEALRIHRLPDVGLPIVLGSLHGGLEATARAALKELGAAEVPFQAFSSVYAASYRQREHRSTRLYDGASELLKSLEARGVAIGVCTNKDAEDAARLLRRLGIAHFFNCVTGPGTTGFPKPSPQPLLHTLKQLDCNPEHSVFIGDSTVDADCAAAAGVPFIFHSSGFGMDSLPGYGAKFKHYGEIIAA